MRLKTSLQLIISAFALSCAVPGLADQCLAIQCDCSGLQLPAERAECMKQQDTLIKDCKLAGQLTGYCRTAGAKAQPLPFALVKTETLLADEDAAKDLLKQNEALFWSVNEDLKTAGSYQAKSAYGNALTAYKSLAATLSRIYGNQRQALDSLIALDEEGEAEDLADDAYPALKQWGDTLYGKARALWGASPESDPKLQSKRQVLAMNVLRYAADAYQQAAELANSANEDNEAGALWREAANAAEVMVSWRVATQAKAQYINYYQQQAEAAWFRAALQWDKAGEAELAAEARMKAEQLSRTKLVQR